MLEYVLFDLDGTLHNLDPLAFVKAYLGAVGGHMYKYGHDPKKLSAAILKGTDAMVANDGKRTNFEVFWDYYNSCFPDKADEDKARFDYFYDNLFDGLRSTSAEIVGAAQAVRKINGMGLKTVLATNPVFPMTAQLKRLNWAGLSKDDFCLITAFEQFHYCKPNPLYYTEIADILGTKPENCLMVGNDFREDIVTAKKAGMDVFLLPECLLNPDNADISSSRQGTFSDLILYIQNVLSGAAK
ncbi:MAG: HAD family hydrolase [Clostridiales bacterium]|nr:HAD family hydrolase [Clostridiales bacterium]